jgi:hypothetical protein
MTKRLCSSEYNQRERLKSNLLLNIKLAPSRTRSYFFYFLENYDLEKTINFIDDIAEKILS